MATIREGIIKRIHVDQHRIRANARDGTDLPVLTVQTYEGPRKAHEVAILGPSRVVFTEKPLSCGARCWIETLAEVELLTRESARPTEETYSCLSIESASPAAASPPCIPTP